MAHELVAFPNGEYSVKPLDSEEAMHSRIGAWTEAHQVYLEPSGLRQRLTKPGVPLVLLDLGMGIAANALAAIECFLGTNPQRDLLVISVEKHLDALRLALDASDHFDWLARNRLAAETLLEKRQWRAQAGTAQVRWVLEEGSFEHMDLTGHPSVNRVFFDFYSPKTHPALWQADIFGRVLKICASDARLTTYSASTSVRAALLLAGFFVGSGPATGLKAETTIASSSAEDLDHPLPPEWLARLARSSKPLPTDWATRKEEAFEKLTAHPQFKNSRCH